MSNPDHFCIHELLETADSAVVFKRMEELGSENYGAFGKLEFDGFKFVKES
jgi:hypothetical protein